MGNLTKFPPLLSNMADGLFRSTLSIIFRLHRSSRSKSYVPSLSDGSKITNLKSDADKSVTVSLFNEIAQIIGAENVIPDKSISGILISKDADSRVVGVTSGLASRAQSVCENTELTTAGKDSPVPNEIQVGYGVDLDVGLVVDEITQIVQAERTLVSMEERLENLGVPFESEVVEKVLNRCSKVPHLALRFFNWVKHREDFSHCTEVYNTLLYITGKDIGLMERLLEEMEHNSCKKDVKTWTILISMYSKAKLTGKALDSFENMAIEVGEIDATTYRTILRTLCNAGKGDVALEIYKEMVQKEIILDVSLYKSVLTCMARSGNAAAAHMIADDMIKVSQILEKEAYGYVLKNFCLSGRIREALEFIRNLKNKKISLDAEYFEILMKGLCRADRISDAEEIFDIMNRRHLLSDKVYGILISGHLRRKDIAEALSLYQRMKESGMLPSTSTYAELIQRLFRLNEYQEGCELYNEMLDKGVDPDVSVINTMVTGHVRQNNLSEAWKLLEGADNKGIQLSRKLYSAFFRELLKVARTDDIFKVVGKVQDAKIAIRDEVFRLVISSMEEKGEVNNVEKVKLMQRICKLQPEGTVSSKDLQGAQEHAADSEPDRSGGLSTVSCPKTYNEQDMLEVFRILSSSEDWCFIQEALEKCSIQFTPELVVDTLQRCSLHGRAALKFFSWVRKQANYQHTTETYNIAIKLSGRAKDFKSMRSLFYEMRRNGFLITSDTWSIMIMQYGRIGLTNIALRTLAEMKAGGCSPSASTYKCLIISLCGRKGRSVNEAVKIFHELVCSGYNPDKELLETYLGCLCEVGELSKARSCVDYLQKVGFTIPLSYSLYVRALCRAGRLEEALEIIDNIKTDESTLHQYVYGSIVHGLLQKGQLEQALAKMDTMKQSGIYPTVHVYTSFLVYYFKERQIEKALEILEQMKHEGCQPTVVTYSALVRGYMDMGKLDDAWTVFNEMKLKGPPPDFKTYSMFINCLCKVGKSEAALELLSEMPDRGIAPSTINFRTVFFGLNREGKNDLARAVIKQKSALATKRRLCT